MKTGKIFGLLGLALCAVFTSCDEEFNDDYTAASVSGAQVYFSSEAPSVVEVSKDTTACEISLNRAVTAGSLEVALNVTSTSDLYSIPSKVTFADGADSAPISIKYDGDAIEYGVFDTVTVSLADATITSSWGVSSYTFVIGCPEPWTEWAPFAAGTCTWTYTQYYNGDDPGLKIYYRSNKVNTAQAQFLIKNALSGIDVVFDYNTETGAVTLPETKFDVHSSYGDVFVSDLDTYAGNGQVGAFDAEQGIIEIPLIYYVGAGYFGYGYEYIYIDGYNRKDLTTEVTYAGKFEDAEGNLFVVASANLGPDVESAQLALIPGELTQELFDEILGGTYTQMMEIAASGEYRMPADSLETGKYSFVLVSYSEGEAADYATAAFKYTNSAEPAETWTDLYVGNYTYTLFFGSEEEPYTDENLVLSVSDSDPSRYKISNWGYGVDFMFTMAEDGTILVDDCETGYVHSQVGMIYVVDYVTYTGSPEAPSSYDPETGTFNFALVYYYDGGYAAFGYEKFVLTAAAGAKNRIAKADKELAKKNVSCKLVPTLKNGAINAIPVIR